MNFNKQQLASLNPIVFGRIWFGSTSEIQGDKVMLQLSVK